MKICYAPHQSLSATASPQGEALLYCQKSLSATAGCRSCLKRQFGKKSPPRGSQVMRRNSDFERFITNYSLSYCPSSPPLRGRASPQEEAAKRQTVFAEKNKVLCIFSGKRKSREQGANIDFKQFVTIRYETRDARRTSCYTRNEQNIVSAIKNAKLNAENIARYFPADSG